MIKKRLSPMSAKASALKASSSSGPLSKNAQTTDAAVRMDVEADHIDRFARIRSLYDDMSATYQGQKDGSSIPLS